MPYRWRQALLQDDGDMRRSPRTRPATRSVSLSSGRGPFGPLCHSPPRCTGYLATDKRPGFLSRYQCLFSALSCHASPEPMYPFRSKEKTGAITLIYGPCDQDKTDPSPPLPGIIGVPGCGSRNAWEPVPHKTRQPEGSPMYFGVDHDYFRTSELDRITPY